MARYDATRDGGYYYWHDTQEPIGTPEVGEEQHFASAEVYEVINYMDTLQAENRTLRADKERLDWLERNYAEVTFTGVEAERVPGGSIVKDYWKVDPGSEVHFDGSSKDFAVEAIGLRAAIDKAKD